MLEVLVRTSRVELDYSLVSIKEEVVTNTLACCFINVYFVANEAVYPLTKTHFQIVLVSPILFSLDNVKELIAVFIQNSHFGAK